MRVLSVKVEKDGTIHAEVAWSDGVVETVTFAPWINANDAMDYLTARDNERVQAAASAATRQSGFEALCEK
jgi:hypothetical protein